MQFQTKLTQLIKQNNPQIQNIRNRAINGNQQYLTYFINSLKQLIRNVNTHECAYLEISQLLASADIRIIKEIDKQLISFVAEKFSKIQLIGYVQFWRKIGSTEKESGYYPKIGDKLINIQKSKNQNIMDMSPFREFYSKYLRNSSKNIDSYVEFFIESSNSIALTQSNQIQTLEVSSQTIQQEVNQIVKIRERIENQIIKKSEAKDFMDEVKKFLSFRPKSMRKQISIGYNSQRIWAKELLQNYRQKDFNERVCVYGKPVNNDQKYLNQGKQKKQDNPSRQFSYKEGTFHHSPTFLKESSGKNGKRISDTQNQNYLRVNDPIKSFQIQKQPSFGDSYGFHLRDSPQYANGVLKSDEKQSKLKPKMSSFQDKPGMQRIVENENDRIQDENQDNTRNFYVNAYKMQRQSDYLPKQFISHVYYQPQSQPQVNQAFSTNSYYSQTTPYQIDQKKPKLAYNYSEYGRQASQNISKIVKKDRKLIKSNSADNLLNQQSSRKRPKIFQREDDEPSENNLPVFIHGSGKRYEGQMNAFQRKCETENQYQLNSRGIVQVPYGQNNSAKNTFISDVPQNSEQSDIHKMMRKLQNRRTNQYQNENKNIKEKVKSVKKFSQFSQQKQKRKQSLQGAQFINPEPFLLEPYLKNFSGRNQFNIFRHNCLRSQFLLYKSSELEVYSKITRVSPTKCKINLRYINLSNQLLDMTTIYRISKCMTITKNTQIRKNWHLLRQYSHQFTVQLLSFPLQLSFLWLKYSYFNKQAVENKDIAIPLTIKNFIQFLLITCKDWQNKWTSWLSNQNTHLTGNIFCDAQLRQKSLILNFPQFISLPSQQNFSTQQIGTLCSQTQTKQTNYLLKISQRVENILTIELLADKKIENQDQMDFCEYFFGIWGVLLAKFEQK